MATQTDQKDWTKECIESIDLKVPNAVRSLVAEQLNGIMQERPFKAGELGKLATALLELPKTDEATE